MRRTILATSVLWAIAFNACAGSLPVTLLSDPAGVDEACKSLPQTGVTCIHSGSSLSPGALGNGSLPIGGADLFFLDRSDGTLVKGFLMLEPMSTAAGNPYYVASAKLYKTGFAHVGMTETDVYDKQFWDQVGLMIPFSAPGSPDEQRFLYAMDAQIAAGRQALAAREATARAAAAEAASTDAYRASPQYALEQSRQLIESCKVTIARARKEIAQDERVARISGYENKMLRETAAMSIVYCEDAIARANGS